jgi:hypothetical protein
MYYLGFAVAFSPFLAARMCPVVAKRHLRGDRRGRQRPSAADAASEPMPPPPTLGGGGRNNNLDILRMLEREAEEAELSSDSHDQIREEMDNATYILFYQPGVDGFVKK